MNYTAILEEIRTIARTAGDAIMSVYARGFRVELKADRSPVTEADRAADGVICSGLAKLRPALPVLSEESALTAWEERRQWKRYWLVDPWTARRNSSRGNGEFTVNIALVEDHRAVLGVVLAPALNLEFSGLCGTGAWRRDADGSQVPVRASRGRSNPLRVMGSRSHPGPGLSAFLARLGPYELHPMGSSLKACMVAGGQADIYPRLGPTSEWDTGAAQAYPGECRWGYD